MNADHVLVLGGSGFVGRSIRAAAVSHSGQFDFLARKDPVAQFEIAETVKIDLVRDPLSCLAGYEHAIWVAGNAEHSLAWVDPISDIEAQTLALLRFLMHFRGSLTLLSSQAVYFGLSGEVREDVDHVPNMPYGFAKLAAERYAQWALEAGRLKRLWIHRLMYTFGPGEKAGRLLGRCIQASHDHGTVMVSGGGRSFLNPLPVGFLAHLLIRSACQLREESAGFLQVTNVNHPETWSVLQVVRFLASLSPFEHEVVEGGERWPVTFYGNVERLLGWLERWGMTLPDVRSSLIDYRNEVLGTNDP